MERIGQILRALFRRALSEHGQEAPALTDILIERARAGIEPRLGAQFANGYQTWADLRPADCYGFCARHGAWDLDSLRRALLREGQQIYARMRADYLFELSRARVRREQAAAAHRDEARSLLERLQRRTAFPEPDQMWRQHAEFYETPPAADAGRRRRESRLMAWLSQQRSQLASSVLFLRGSSPDIGRSKRAHERGLELLKQNLTVAQRRQFEAYGYFDVVGGKSGKRYRIRNGCSMNIDQLDKNGRRVCGWCFFPQGNLVPGDVMLAQKVALELFETEALHVANRF
jgi:hypothetical protein